jgi:hypothetical protein
MKARAIALITLAAALLAAPRTSAYCLGRTCNPSTDDCELDDDDCVVTGAPLHWAPDCVTFDVQVDGSPKSGLDADAVTVVVERAFKAWLEADCGNGTPSIEVGTFGPVACSESLFNETGRNANIVMFRDDAWPYPDEEDAYGKTMLRYDTHTGALRDADIELNTADFDVGADGDPERVDLESILTHEIGHFLGLGHPGRRHPAATMSAGWDGEGMGPRTLDDDDVAGICELYPPGRRAPTSCEPVNGFSGECFVPASSRADASCTVVGLPASNGATAPTLVALVALACWRRRSARRARS